MLNKEYGGYIEFENQRGIEYHKDAVALNCGRNCLAYLIEAYEIEKIYLPYFLCGSVKNVCLKYDIDIEYYHIDEKFLPRINVELKEKEYLYVVNYYGQLDNAEISRMKAEYDNLIIDNAQSFFQMPVKGVDTLYTCRKFFGVSDGAYLYTNRKLQKELESDYSYDRMHFLLGRYERGANEFYNEYVENNKRFQNEPILKMSLLTENLLRGLDYEKISQCRTENFVVLHEGLKGYNLLKELSIPNGAFMYPLLIRDGASVRKKLQVRKIYIPTLWPDVFEMCDKTSLEYDMAKNILPIPVDQRYNKKDMEYLIEVVRQCID